MKITKFLLIILFFTLPLIHGKLFPTLGIDFYVSVSGNFEFTKAIFFNIFSGIIFLSFYVEQCILKPLSFSKGENSSVNSSFKYTWIILGILILSNFFSISPFTSLIGDIEKGHTTLLFLNLLGVFFILRCEKKLFLRKLLFISIFSGVFVSVIASKELFFETYNYGELGNRALGTLGHPNYLAGYLLILLPLSALFKNKYYKYIIILFLMMGIIFSQSIVALFLAVLYILYLFYSSVFGFLSKKMKKILQYTSISFIVSAFFIFTLVLVYFFPEKLHSFLSRFYLWETTFKIIFSDWKILFFGGGLETLPYLFDSFKSPELYIFENYGYSADRPHNFFLNIFYHFGIFGVLLFLYILYTFLKSLKSKITPLGISIILFLLFGIFHFFSITSYLLIIGVIALIQQTPTSIISFEKSTNHRKIIQYKNTRKEIIIGMFFVIFSLTGAYYSYNLYRAEILFLEKDYEKAQDTFPHPKYLIELEKYSEAQKLEGILSQRNLRDQIIIQNERMSLCSSLIKKYPSAENFFYCGHMFERLGKQELSISYYSQGLQKLPNLWDTDSSYWDSYFIKNTITGNRFFSSKHGDIKSILEKVEK